MEISEDVVIVGAGIAGLATALTLKRVGVRALVLERSPELRSTSAAIALSSNGWIALHHLGVAHKLISIYPPTLKVSVTDVANGAIQGKRNESRLFHRKALLEALAEELPPGTIRFSSKLISIQAHITHEGFSIATLQLDDGTIIKAKVLVGCDGLHSVVAKWFGLKAPVHSGRAAVRGLTVFPQGHGFKQETQQFVKPGLRGTFVPITDKDVYWYLVYYSSSTAMGTHMGTPFQRECNSLGQGAGSALEDATILGQHIGNSFVQNGGRIMPAEVARAIEGYVNERRWCVIGLVMASYLAAAA